MKSIFKSRTFWVAVASYVIPLLVNAVNGADTIPADVRATIASALMVAMRLITKEPVKVV